MLSILRWHCISKRPRRLTAWVPGICLRTASLRPRPRPNLFKAKAAEICPRGVLEFEASPWWVMNPSHSHTEEYVTLNSKNCLITSCCTAYCPNAGLAVSSYRIEKCMCRTDILETKDSSQCQASSKQMPPTFVFDVSSCSKPVLKDPFPAVRCISLRVSAGYSSRLNSRGVAWRLLLGSPWDRRTLIEHWTFRILN